jgi:hypothetical protein
MSHLNLKQVEKCYQDDRKLDWHDNYEREVWKDRPGPLTVTGVSEIDWMTGKDTERCGFIKYTCSDPNCRACTDETLVLKGHHKVIKLNGLDPFGKVIFKETKKRTIINIEDQPVFKEYTDVS